MSRGWSRRRRIIINIGGRARRSISRNLLEIWFRNLSIHLIWQKVITIGEYNTIIIM